MGTSIKNSTTASSIQETTELNQTIASSEKSASVDTENLPQPSYNYSVDCSEKAIEISRSHNYLFSKEQVAKLCRGVQSTAPADCAAKAADIKRSHSYFLNADQIVSLCKGVLSSSPAECAEKASEIKRGHKYFYTPEDVVELCKAEKQNDKCP